ncbi:DeoR/GlpR family DNA-binding transcription regulator [Siphonobacter sp.]|uniref:DeoR/GlpR family DNA-binding transcription regulator n=1 Tax=Siphonobacter sp. TaxID=1869184 RepID=UPI003B3A8DE3
MITVVKKERKELILKHINIHSRVTFGDLSQLLHVSEETIRRDLNELSDERLIIKIKGGAMAVGNHFSPQSEKSLRYASTSKERIAQKAISLVRDGMIVLIGGGTTVQAFIEAIPDQLRATFVTVNPHTCIALLNKPNLETILIGGKVSTYSQTVIGGDAFLKLADIRADLCIMGTNAIDPTEGITDLEWETVEIKKAMFKAAKTIVILAIAEKLNTSMKLRVCPVTTLDYLITELDASHPSLQPYLALGVKTL